METKTNIATEIIKEEDKFQEALPSFFFISILSLACFEVFVV